MTMAGSHASAMAIIARWRMPPESSCGYAEARAAGMPTRSSSSAARLRDASRDWPSRTSMGSATWWPTRWTGFSAFIAPWKTRLISRQRYRLSCRSLFCARSMPNSLTDPLRILPFAGRSWTSESAVVVLPQPDSPAMPRASPSSRRNETPSTAFTEPPGILKRTARFSTSRSGAEGSACLGSGHWRRPRIRAGSGRSASGRTGSVIAGPSRGG